MRFIEPGEVKQCPMDDLASFDGIGMVSEIYCGLQVGLNSSFCGSEQISIRSRYYHISIL